METKEGCATLVAARSGSKLPDQTRSSPRTLSTRARETTTAPVDSAAGYSVAEDWVADYWVAEDWVEGYWVADYSEPHW